jgi:hypothetical protein
MTRPLAFTLTILFLAIIFAVPLAQGVIDLRFEQEPKPIFFTLFDHAPREAQLRAFETRLEDSSFFGRQLRAAFQLTRYVLLRDLGDKALAGRDGWYFYTPDVRYLVEPYFRESQKPAEPDPVEVIRDFAQQLRRRKIELLVVPVPVKASLYPQQLTSAAQPEPAVAAHTFRFIRELQQRGVSVLNLHSVLAAQSQHCPALYMKTDTHWTGEGARLAAGAVAAVVKQQAWYKRLPATPRYLRRPITVVRRGDIPRMTQIPFSERFFAPETIDCQQIVSRQGGELYEEPDEPVDAPILVLGDSFSRVFETDEPEAAGWIANLAYELQLPVASIVNDGGASTLVRQELAKNPDLLQGKQLVIWAFVERDIRFGLKGWQPLTL